MQPNFVLMKLPGENDVEFVEILPFTPDNRNNLIGWIAGTQRRRDTMALRWFITFPKRNWLTDRCRSRRESIRTRSSPAS